MRHRRSMKHAVADADRLDFGEVGQRLRHHDAVRKHRALRAAGSAAGIEQPGKIVGAALDHIDAVAAREAPPIRAVGRDGTGKRRGVVGAIGAGENQRRLGVADDVAEFVAMELGVHRHGDEAGMPNRKQRFEEFRPVGHGDRHAIVRLAKPRRLPASARVRAANCR